MARPDGLSCDQAHAVPDDVKMLPPVFDMLDNHALVVEHFIAVFFFAAFNDGQHLLVGQAFVLHRVNADVVQRLFAFGAACDFPHF